MNNKSQSYAKASPLARSEELKPSTSTVAVHKNPMAFTGYCGREFPSAFCFILKHLPVCLRAEFQSGGRINDRNEKTLGSILEPGLLKTS